MQKKCRTCEKIYEGDALKFCLQCGGLLENFGGDRTTPLRQENTTVRETSPFQTKNSGFDDYAEKPFGHTVPNSFGQPSQWTPPPAPVASWQNQPIGQNTPFMSPPAGVVGQNHTLAVTSLCLGIASVTIGWCCSLGLILSPAALITGFIALSQIKKNPELGSSKGLALAGIITGGIYAAVMIAVILIYVVMTIIAIPAG